MKNCSKAGTKKMANGGMMSRAVGIAAPQAMMAAPAPTKKTIQPVRPAPAPRMATPAAAPRMAIPRGPSRAQAYVNGGVVSAIGRSDPAVKGTDGGAELTFPAGAATIGNTLGGGPKSDGRSYKK